MKVEFIQSKTTYRIVNGIPISEEKRQQILEEAAIEFAEAELKRQMAGNACVNMKEKAI